MEQKTETSGRKTKTSKSRRETAVQGTNDNSIVSKCSMSAAGYFNDFFLQHFVAKTTRRAPLINRGYYIRAVCIDQVFKQFLTRYQGSKNQIVSLGAGFDSAYFRLKAEGLLTKTSFFEIDFPEVTKRKHAIIEDNTTLFGLLSFDGSERELVPPIELRTADYCLLGVDLTQLNTVEAALRLCGADFDLPTLLLSECVMTYMTRRCSSALVKWAGETFQDAFFVMFEQINPDDAFGIFMQNHFHTIGSPLKCITSFPTVESQIRRFLDLGWHKCKCQDLNEVYRHSLTVEERSRVETLDPFDEYEEFNLKCAHYFLLVASTASSVSDFIYSTPLADIAVNQPNPVAGMVLQTTLPADKAVVKRFSHTSTLVGGRYILTAGGFGEVDGRHQRVQEVSVTDTVTMETSLVRCRSEDIQYSRMYHSSVLLSDGRVLLLGGRQSPFFLCSQLLLMDLVISSAVDGVSVPAGLQRSVQHTPDSVDRHVDLSSTGSSSECLLASFSGNVTESSRESVQGTSYESDMLVQHSQLTNSDETYKSDMEQCRELSSSGRMSRYDASRIFADTGKGQAGRTLAISCTNCGGSVRITNGGGGGDGTTMPTCGVNSCVCDKPMSAGNVDSKAMVFDSTTTRPGIESSAHSSQTSPMTEREERTDFEGGYLVASVLKQSGDIPCARWRHASALVTVEGHDCLFLHGGRTQKAEVLSDAYLFDIHSGMWTKVRCSGDHPGHRHSHAMVRWEREAGEQQVVVVGGMDGDQNPQASVHLLCLLSLTWRILDVSGSFLPRYSHTCHLVGDRLVCVGGVNLCRQTPGVAVVNLSTGHVQEFSFPSVSREQLLMYHRHDSVMLPDGTIIVLGGGGNCFSFGTHLNHTPILLDITSCLEAAH